MAGAWELISDPKPELLAALAAERPDNPFWSPAYLEARRRMGGEPAVFCAGDADRVRVPVILRRGRVRRAVEFPSLPALPCDDPFWTALLAWRADSGIGCMELNTFASSEGPLPDLPGPWRRRARLEYVLDLRAPAPALSSNHTRNVKRARRAELSVVRRTDEAACDAHVALMAVSMDRRRQRGESIADERADALRQTRALVGAGAGALFQVVADNTALSSILVLQASAGGYYHSAGSSADGMSRGASHLLVVEIAERLRAEGAARFNLGGVGEAGSGLEQFKRGFGAAVVRLEAMEAVWPRSWAVVRKGWEMISRPFAAAAAER